jgi:hypothetical protein
MGVPFLLFDQVVRKGNRPLFHGRYAGVPLGTRCDAILEVFLSPDLLLNSPPVPFSSVIFYFGKYCGLEFIRAGLNETADPQRAPFSWHWQLKPDVGRCRLH